MLIESSDGNWSAKPGKPKVGGVGVDAASSACRLTGFEPAAASTAFGSVSPTLLQEYP